MKYLYMIIVLISLFSCNENNFPTEHKYKEKSSNTEQSENLESNMNQMDSLTVKIDSVYSDSTSSRYIYVDILIKNKSSITIKDLRKKIVLIIYENDSKDVQIKQDYDYLYIGILKTGETLKHKFSIYYNNWLQYPDFTINEPIFEDY